MPDSGKLLALLDQWRAASSQGRSPAPAELCPDDPEMAEYLQHQIEFLRTLEPNRKTTDFAFKTMPPDDPPRTAPGELASGSTLTAKTDFESGRLLGKGGIGIVYVANDRQMCREVAVKLMRSEVADDGGMQAELVREAEITGKLEHPGVVPVYGLGRCGDGRTFYVMRLIQGTSLEAAIGEYHAKTAGPAGNSEGQRNLDFRNLLSRFVSVCYTVGYAHNRGIIHRDIKPENIMLGKYGETLLVDWGLAMPVDRDQIARASGERTLQLKTTAQSGNSSGFPIGTPVYMSPEQAEASDMLTPATDVYSLGATLYKILTNKIPVEGKDVFEVIRNVKDGRITPPHVRNPKTPKELDAICRKAMAKNPADRYGSPLELAADVEHWLADEPVSVYSETRSAKLGRWLRRHRAVALAATLCTIGLLVAAFASAVALKGTADREHAGREENLRLAAKFAARLIASEIDLRFRILEKEAADPKLVQLVAAESAKPDEAHRRDIQDWLNEVIQTYQGADASASWFVDDVKGAIVAIAGTGITPEMRGRTIGKNFAHRDYFHGQGRHLDPKEATGIAPTGEPVLSSVYRSTTDKLYKVAFSVPIRTVKSGRSETIGVLAMTFKVGSFEALRTISKKDQSAVLIDTRGDDIDSDLRHGLILHHRLLAKRQFEGEKAQNFRVSPEFLERLVKLRSSARAAEIERAAASDADVADIDNLLRGYVDPLSPEGTMNVAAEPIVVPSRTGKLRDTGWFVIVQGN